MSESKLKGLLDTLEPARTIPSPYLAFRHQIVIELYRCLKKFDDGTCEFKDDLNDETVAIAALEAIYHPPESGWPNWAVNCVVHSVRYHRQKAYGVLRRGPKYNKQPKKRKSLSDSDVTRIAAELKKLLAA